ncbi:MAG: hypothetical protein HUU21_18900 [Polyangiaceae bacterium]|nr:hypothetical protein [Polyangiaceae bacterium]NUQ75619.1 hypothetical protein [Polyangiaceae bacterium]
MGPPSVVLLPQIRASSDKSSIAPAALHDALFALVASSAALLIDGLPGQSENLALLPKILPQSGAFTLSIGKDALASPSEALAPLVEQALAQAAKS